MNFKFHFTYSQYSSDVPDKLVFQKPTVVQGSNIGTVTGIDWKLPDGSKVGSVSDKHIQQLNPMRNEVQT